MQGAGYATPASRRTGRTDATSLKANTYTENVPMYSDSEYDGTFTSDAGSHSRYGKPSGYNGGPPTVWSSDFASGAAGGGAVAGRTESGGYAPPGGAGTYAYRPGGGAVAGGYGGASRASSALGSSTHSSEPPNAAGSSYGVRRGGAGGVSAYTSGTMGDMWLTNDPRIATAIAPDQKGKLENALDNLAVSGEPFLGGFTILSSAHRREGGQGIVQFARGVRDGQDYAIKFFTVREAFEREDALYSNAVLRDMMPAVRQIEANADGRLRSRSGWPFPPCVPHFSGACVLVLLQTLLVVSERNGARGAALESGRHGVGAAYCVLTCVDLSLKSAWTRPHQRNAAEVLACADAMSCSAVGNCARADECMPFAGALSSSEASLSISI